jgi:excisionase family DNA binding protein
MNRRSHKMIDADELAKKLSVSRRQIQLLCERREIPHYKVGAKLLRFNEEEVMRVIAVKPRRGLVGLLASETGSVFTHGEPPKKS